MRRPPVLLRTLMLSAALPTINAFPSGTNIFARDDTCAAAGLSSCPNHPDNFCCRPTETCISLAGGTTVICCPEGNKCDKVQPITCDVSMQDPRKGLDLPVKTTALDGTLPRCGSNCCPFGYRCKDGECFMDDDQSLAPTDPKTSQAPGLTTPPSTTAQATATASAGTDPSKKATEGEDPPKPFPTAQVVAGVISGVAVLIGLVLAIMFYRNRKNKAAAAAAAGLKGQAISGPTLEMTSLGGDFLKNGDLERPDSSSTQTTAGPPRPVDRMDRPDSMEVFSQYPNATRAGLGRFANDGREAPQVRPLRVANRPEVNVNSHHQSIPIAFAWDINDGSPNGYAHTDDSDRPVGHSQGRRVA
jgi:hypothetical protein